MRPWKQRLHRMGALGWRRLLPPTQVALLLASLLLVANVVQATATFTVNSTADLGDSYLADGICDTANYPLSRQGRPPIPRSGICTLRAALMQANSTPAPDIIAFNLPGPGPHTIALATMLPTITNPVVIDGTTQPGYTEAPRIELDGSGVPPPTPTGLVLPGDSTVRGLAIYGFGGVGLLLMGYGRNVVQGNFIGVRAEGTQAPGNGLDGVRIDGSGNNVVGGTTAAARNVIAGNRENGVSILGDPGSSATRNRVQGNYIGTDATGSRGLGNALDGVHIDGAANSIIGGPEAAAGNIIAFNSGAGVRVQSGEGNPIWGNSIFSNHGLGIDLGPPGVTPNDPADADSGANDLQNFPVLTGVGAGASLGGPPGVDVRGRLSSRPNELFSLQFYSSPTCHPSGYGEGKTFIRLAPARTDGNGDASFSATWLGSVPAGHFITATATDSRNNTSEFSQCQRTGGGGTPEPTATLPPSTPTRTPAPTSLAETTPTTIVECPVADVRGEFEPSQGVWQDDDTFPDQSGKQLTRVSATELQAELPMVTGRSTRLYGTRAARRPELPPHQDIFVTGRAQGTTVVPVKFRFTLADSSGRRAVHEVDAEGTIRLGPPCASALSDFSVRVPTGGGLPPAPAPGFQIRGPGTYTLELEVLRRDGSATNLPRIRVKGKIVDTIQPKVLFVPLQLRGETIDRALEVESQRLARELSRLGDYFPIVDAGPLSSAGGVFDAREILGMADEVFFDSVRLRGSSSGRATIRMLEREPRQNLSRQRLAEARRAMLNDTFGSSAVLGSSHRVVLVLSDGDFDLVRAYYPVGDGSPGQPQEVAPAAFASSRKVIYTRANQDHWTIAHELIHTLGGPGDTAGWVWSDYEMERDCRTRSYHNQDVPWADGVNIRTGTMWQDFTPVMGPSGRPLGVPVGAPESRLYWNDQCTYWQVLNRLQRSPDPEVLMVRGILLRGAQSLGALLPAYQLQGEADLEAGASGSYAIVLRGASGELARYPFTPAWTLPTHPPTEQDLVSFTYRVPRLAGVTQIDLTGPGGLLDSLRLSASAPAVAITAPSQGTAVQPVDGKVSVKWTGRDADGDALAYSVFYSSDGGETWQMQSFEQSESELAVVVDFKGTGHRVKVIAADGTRSAEVVVGFAMAASPTPALPPTPARQVSGAPGMLRPVLGTLAAVLVGLSLGGLWWLRRRRSKGGTDR